MGHRGTEGSRTPADWHGQRSGRPRSYSARAALEPPAGESGVPGAPGAHDDDGGDDDPGHGEWAAAPWDDGTGLAQDAGGSGGAGARGPARGFPPAPGQPDPVYPQSDFDSWNDADTDGGQWAGAPADAGHWDDAGPGGQGGWHGAQTDDWGEAGRTGEWAGSQTAEWAQADQAGHPDAEQDRWDPDEYRGPSEYGDPHDHGGSQEHTGPGAPGDGGDPWQPGAPWDAEPRRWGEGSGQWDAPYGHWDEHGQWHQPGEPGDDGSGYVGAAGQPGYAGTGEQNAGYPGHRPQDAAGWDRDEGAGWGPADYPGYGYPGEEESDDAESGDGTGPRSASGRRGARGRRDAGSLDTEERGPGAPGGRAGRTSRSRTAARGPRTKTILLITAGVVVVAALGATAYTVLAGRPGHSGTAASTPPGVSVPKIPSPTASSTSGASKLGKWGYITTRSTDSAPLTVTELYPAQFQINGSSFIRTTDRADTDCNQGLFGSQLQNAAKVYGCTQVVRASYVSTSQTMMGTIGVVNLLNANDAAKAGNASGSTDFVTPLNGKTGPTKSLSQGTGVVQAEFKGHYLILIWAEFTNLKAPSTQAQRTQLEQFSSALISGSANIALSNRMVNGHPEATGAPG